MLRLQGVALAAAAGCTVVDAPQELEALAVFGFVHHADPGRAEVEAAAGGVYAQIETHREALALGLRIDALGQADLTEAGVDSDVQVGIVGAATLAEYASALDDVANAWSWPHMDEVIDSTIAHRIDREEGDRSCFLAHACETYAMDG